jgi:hypothetical protein
MYIACELTRRAATVALTLEEKLAGQKHSKTLEATITERGGPFAMLRMQWIGSETNWSGKSKESWCSGF